MIADRERALALAAGLAGGALAAAAALLALGGVPHLTDEVVYTLQSRLFAAGVRTGPADPEPGLLLYPFWAAEPRGYGVFPPGWPALLALGEAIGAPWLVNPLLFALAPPLLWLAGREIAPRSAVLAAWLLALSPAAWILAGSRMAHTGVLVGLLAAATVIVRARDAAWAWALAGLGVGYTALARPFDAALFGGPLLLAGLLRAPGWPARLALLLPPLAAGALTLADNAQITGDPLTFPVNPWFDAWAADSGRAPGCNRLGFGADVGCFDTLGGPGHTPAKAARFALDSLRRLDLLLLGLPGGLAVAAAGLWAAGRRAGALLALPLLLAIGGYALYWSPGMAYGPRFWHPALPGLALLAACVAVRAAGRLSPLLLLIPLLGSLRVWPELRDYWCVSGGLAAQLEARGIDEGVLFVRSQGRQPAAWPALGVAEFACEPMLSFGEALLLWDPSQVRGGVQPRLAPADLPSVLPYLAAHHPGAPAYLAYQDLAAGPQWRLARITPDGLVPLGDP